jgi:hypothetical protein
MVTILNSSSFESAYRFLRCSIVKITCRQLSVISYQFFCFNCKLTTAICKPYNAFNLQPLAFNLVFERQRNHPAIIGPAFTGLI